MTSNVDMQSGRGRDAEIMFKGEYARYFPNVNLTVGIAQGDFQGCPRPLSYANCSRRLFIKWRLFLSLYIPQFVLVSQSSRTGGRARQTTFSHLSKWKIWLSCYDMLRFNANAEWLGVILGGLLRQTSPTVHSRWGPKKERIRQRDRWTREEMCRASSAQTFGCVEKC